MKTIFYSFCVFCLVLLVNANVSAQDLIYLKGIKQPQRVKVVEMGLEEVKYIPYNDTTSPVLVYSHLQLDRVVLKNGSVFEFKQNNPMGIAADYEGQRKSILKINPFSPMFGHTAFTFEHCTKPGRSYEVGLSFIGLGNTYEELYTVDPKPAGATMRFGLKMISTPSYYTRGMRQTHILKGPYLKPEMVLSVYQITREAYDYRYYYSRTDTERRNVIAGAMMINFGYQWVVSDCISFDTYMGFGIGFCNYHNPTYGQPEVIHYGFLVAPVLPAALTGGFRMGYLLKDKGNK